MRSRFARLLTKRCGYVGLPQGGEGGPRQRWMRMSAHTLWESILPSAYLWVCIILDTSRIAGDHPPRFASQVAPTGLCVAGLCVGDYGRSRTPVPTDLCVAGLCDFPPNGAAARFVPPPFRAKSFERGRGGGLFEKVLPHKSILPFPRLEIFSAADFFVSRCKNCVKLWKTLWKLCKTHCFRASCPPWNLSKTFPVPA